MTVSQCIRLARKFQLCGSCCNGWNGPDKGETIRDIKTVDDLIDENGYTPDHAVIVVDVRGDRGQIEFRGNSCDGHAEIFATDGYEVKIIRTLEAYSE